MKAIVWVLALCALGLPRLALAEDPFKVAPTEVTDWKTVYGQIEAKDMIPARARLGGTLVSLGVSEGDVVAAGQELGKVVDAKIAFQINAIDAQIAALDSQLSNAKSDLNRAEALRARGVMTAQAYDALKTQVSVLEQQIEAQKASRQVTEQAATEGAVLAPIAGRVLDVPVARGAVVMAGETVATVGGGGVFLRLSVPERFAATLHEGDAIAIEAASGAISGKLAKVYPLIEGGRVNADVEVPDLKSDFVGERVLVKLPLATRQAFMVPAALLHTRSGLDFLRVQAGDAVTERTVVPGPKQSIDGVEMVEIVSGLSGGEEVVGDE